MMNVLILGACTCVVRRYTSDEEKRVECLSVNACLTPICALDSTWITTVEGLGTAAAPHAVQERFAALFASQCGFCKEFLSSIGSSDEI